MNKKFFSLVFILFLLCWVFPHCTLAKQEEQDYSMAIRLIDIWLEAQRDFDRLPGISVGIVIDQKLIWSKGYGFADIEKEVNSSPDTIYSICSISKLFTSVAIMQLRDAGKLRLEDRVGDVLPWWGETAVIPWQDKLAVLGLPSENPDQGLTLLKYIKGDTFRRIRKDETLGEEVIFERDDSGKVVRMWQHSNYEEKIR